MEAESVYKIIPPAPTPRARPRMYHSHAGAAPPSCSTFGFANTSKILANVAGARRAMTYEGHPSTKKFGSFGRVVAPSIDPHHPLQKGTGPHVLKQVHQPDPHQRMVVSPTKKQHLPTEDTKPNAAIPREAVPHNPTASGVTCLTPEASTKAPKPPIPPLTEKPIMGLMTDKDYVAANAIESGTTAPRKRVPMRDIVEVDITEYGRVPEYLSRVKQQVGAESQQLYQTQVHGDEEAAATSYSLLHHTQATGFSGTSATARTSESRYSELTDQDVQEIREGLRARLERLTKQFQTLKFTLETVSQLRRKEALEREIHEVEVALTKVSKRRVLVRTC